MDIITESLKSGNVTQSLCTEKYFGPKRDSIYVIIPILIIYLIIFLTGTIGNISTCIVISKNKSMHTATNYYLFNLAISDLLLLLSGLPQEAYSIYSRYPYIFGRTFCFLRGLFAETSTNATVLTITAFTVERYLAICHPFLSHTMSKLSRAVKLILAIWLLSIGLAVPQAMQVEMVGTPDCEMCVFTNTGFELSLEVSTFLFFVFPMTLITVLYILIGQKLKSSNMMSRRTCSARIQSRSSRKVVKMLVAVVVAFFVCWAPFHIQRLFSKYSVVAEHDTDTRTLYLKIYEILTYISGILYYVSATINPILYNIMSVKFREAFKETFTRCCRFKTNRPQRTYSVLSRSAQRGPDSTDSGRDDPSVQTQTTLTQKSSIESFHGVPPHTRSRILMTRREAGIEEEQMQDMVWIPDHNNTVNQIVSQNCNSDLNAPSRKFISLQVKAGQPRKLNKFWQYFQCLAKRTLDDSKRFSAYYSSPLRDPSILMELEANSKKPSGVRCTSPCDISNSSLKDIENGAIEDELTTYMQEVQRREFSS